MANCHMILSRIIMNEFAKRLKDLRCEHNLTQTQLAYKTKISQAGIAKWETGDRKPSVEGLIALSKCFGVTIDYLVGLED